MPRPSAAALKSRTHAPERRKGQRQTTVLRVGVLNDGEENAFCIVRNISPIGVQVRLFGKLGRGSEVSLRVGDEDPLSGRVVWVRDQLAGIRFNATLEPERLLRVTEKVSLARRRSSPRLNASARAILRTGGRTYPAELRDISTSGAKVRTLTDVRFGPTLMLTLPDLPPIKTYLRWVADREVGLVFETPLPIQIIADWLDERVTVSAA